MPNTSDPPATRAELSDKIRELAIKLHWFDARPGKEDTAWDLADELIGKTLAYQRLLRDIHRRPSSSSQDP